MIIRVALFLTLVALFYYYCANDGNTNQFRGPNDINMIEVPNEISPLTIKNSNTAFNTTYDSLHFSSVEYLLQD